MCHLWYGSVLYCHSFSEVAKFFTTKWSKQKGEIMKCSSLTISMVLLFLIVAAPVRAEVVTYKAPIAASGAPDFAVKADGKNIFVNPRV